MGSPMLAPGAHHASLARSVDLLVRLNRAGLRGLMAEDCVAGHCARESFDQARAALPADVDFTAIYSRRDGIVDWRACVDPAAHAVEVRSSHVGMAFDPAVIAAVSAALRPPSARRQLSKSIAERSRSFESRCSAVISRTVPLRERITSECVVTPVAAVAHAAHQLAVGDAGGHEEGVVAGDEVVGAEHEVGVEVVPGVQRALALVVVLRPQLALDLAADALHRAGRDDALRGAADAEHQVDAGVGAGGHDRAGHVAVGDVLDAGAGLADVLDQPGVARAVEQHDGDVVDRAGPWPWRRGRCSPSPAAGCRRRRRPRGR